MLYIIIDNFKQRYIEMLCMYLRSIIIGFIIALKVTLCTL